MRVTQLYFGLHDGRSVHTHLSLLRLFIFNTAIFMEAMKQHSVCVHYIPKIKGKDLQIFCFTFFYTMQNSYLERYRDCYHVSTIIFLIPTDFTLKCTCCCCLSLFHNLGHSNFFIFTTNLGSLQSRGR